MDMFPMVPNVFKLTQTVQNCAKGFIMLHNGPYWTEMVQMMQICANWSKVVQNGPK